MKVKARILSVSKEDDLYKAILEIEYNGESFTTQVDHLPRKPVRVKVVDQGDKVRLDITDVEGLGIASFIIHKSHLEKGCMDCRSLLLPA